MKAEDAAIITRLHWEDQRPKVLEWMQRVKKFTPDAAERACANFIETMVFVAQESGIVQVKVKKPWL